MLGRKSTSKRGKSMPQDWLEGLSRLINETYKSECTKQKRYFDVYGQIFSEEILLIVSFLSDEDAFAAPITCFLSCGPEDMDTEVKVQETQKNFMDIIGLIFDEVFAQEEWDKFEPQWQEVKYKNDTYFHKLSRENIALTLEADKLLGKEFADEEFSDEEYDQ